MNTKRRTPWFFGALPMCFLLAAGCTYEPPVNEASGGNGGSGGDSGAGSAGGGVGGVGGGVGGMGAGGDGGGAPTHELDCLNGMDDDFDGQPDCADSDCVPGYECVPVAPPGSGPYVRISLTTGEAMPATCTVNGMPPTIRGITAASPACTACECNVSNINCRLEIISTYASMDCSGAPLIQPATSECMSLPAPLSTGSVKMTRGQGMATVSVTPAAPLPQQPWKDVVQVCPAYDGSPGAGCATGQFCVPRVTVPYESAVCVHAMGDASCTGEYGRKITAFDSALDSRGCAPCGCNPDIQCFGYYMQLNSGGACNGTMGASAVFDSCVSIKAETGSIQLGTLTSQVGNKNIWGGQPTGGVTPTNQRTFCCTQ